MPVYDYKCAEHGLFHELATVAEAAQPKPCPACETKSPRVIMISPDVLAMAPNARKTAERNERAQHAPVLSTPDYRAELAERRAFELRKSCGCHSHTDDRSQLTQKAILMADGSKVFPSQRPWMISH